jgi:predicted dehydrogenase
MALDMTPEQKAVGKANFNRAVGKLADASAQPARPGVTRRQFMKGLIAAGATAPIAAAAYFGYSNSAFRDRPVRAGLIGAGDEGGVLVGEHNPHYLQFVAYSDIRPTNRRRIFNGEPTGPRKGFKHHYGNDAERDIRYYEKYEDLLNQSDIEAVVIALPLHLHAPVAIAAMNKKKHVLCEKLMAWNITQCKEMVRVANLNDVILSIGHQRHYSMLYAHAVEVLNSGVLGDRRNLRHIRALWHRNNVQPRIVNGHPVTEVVTVGGEQRTIPVYRDGWRPDIPQADRAALAHRIAAGEFDYKDMEELVRWRLYKRTGGGLMAELGSHQLDACSIFLGKVHPLAVTAVGGKYFYTDDREVEDHVFCTFEFPGPDYWRDEQRHIVNKPDDIRVVTYSSISTNSFEPYGECVMGSQGTMVVESEQSVMLWGTAGRSTPVTVNTAGSGPVLDSSASGPAEVRATDMGLAALGHAPVSRGYREEMEHFAYCIRMREEVTAAERGNYKPRCDGPAAMADAIIALTANQAMHRPQEEDEDYNPRIEFCPEWFDATKPDVPDANMIARPARG